MSDATFAAPSRSRGLFAAALFAGGLVIIAGMLAHEFAPEPDTRTASGFPTVLDGDSLRIAGREIRLHGIDAPEWSQTCTDAAGRPWACGAAATALLQATAAAGGAHVSCVTIARDKYRRFISTCVNAAGEDLSAIMVRHGLAIAYRRYSEKYVGEESEARAAKRGIWQGAFDEPEAWRRANPRGK
jgi:endonuclease YncB( thermonuclease family)